MSSDLITFHGPPLTGRTTFGAHLGVEQLDDEPPVGISWRGRLLEVDLGYRGARYRPRLSQEGAEVLRRAAGGIFVVDSQRERTEANLYALSRLSEQLGEVGRDRADLPLVFALNKRDLSNILSVNVLIHQFLWPWCDHVETTASAGLGLDAALDRLLVLVDERRALLERRR